MPLRFDNMSLLAERINLFFFQLQISFQFQY